MKLRPAGPVLFKEGFAIGPVVQRDKSFLSLDEPPRLQRLLQNRNLSLVNGWVQSSVSGGLDVEKFNMGSEYSPLPLIPKDREPSVSIGLLRRSEWRQSLSDSKRIRRRCALDCGPTGIPTTFDLK
jgi:hypothetical protein